MSPRRSTSMSPAELSAFLAGERDVVVATNGPRGFPHLMPLWYVLRASGPEGAPEPWAWTFGRSQKVRNLERDPRATLQVETGTSYFELRGAMLECDVVVHRDRDMVSALGREIFGAFEGDLRASLPDGVDAAVDAQAAKRVGLQFRVARAVTWDHRKLAGRY